MGVSALRQAVVVNMDRANEREETTAVRYTGLVPAIDRYLETVLSWDKADVALRLGVGAGDEGADARSTESRRNEVKCIGACFPGQGNCCVYSI